MAMAMRVAGDKEGECGKAIVMVTRVVGKPTAMATKRVMLMAKREAGKEEGNGKGNTTNGDGKEDGDGERRGQ
jgi:hypothetical protein